MGFIKQIQFSGLDLAKHSSMFLDCLFYETTYQSGRLECLLRMTCLSSLTVAVSPGINRAMGDMTTQGEMGSQSEQLLRIRFVFQIFEPVLLHTF